MVANTKEKEHSEGHYFVDALYSPYGGNFQSIQAAQRYNKIEEIYDKVKAELESKQFERLRLAFELSQLVYNNTIQRQALEKEKSDAAADSTKASCLESAPCDICQGHCEGNNNECREGLVCVSADSTSSTAIRMHCGGTPATDTDSVCRQTEIIERGTLRRRGDDGAQRSEHLAVRGG